MYSARLTDGEIIECNDFKTLYQCVMRNLRFYVGSCSSPYPHSDVYSGVLYDEDGISICYIWVSNISTQIVTYCGVNRTRIMLPRIGYRKLIEKQDDCERRLFHV